jgi:hypothetical protein
VTPSPDVIEAWKRLDAAQKASEKAADARASLPTGSTRAKVTTANARWANAAEDRDRKKAAYIAALMAELQRVQPTAAPVPESDETRLLLAQLYAWLERAYESRHVGLPVVVMVPGADGTELDHFRTQIYAAITRSTP